MIHSSGEWDVYDCSIANHFVCKSHLNCENNNLYYDDHCYRFYSSQKTWTDARNVCLKQGGDLVSTPDSQSHAFAHSVIGSYNVRQKDIHKGHHALNTFTYKYSIFTKY